MPHSRCWYHAAHVCCIDLQKCISLAALEPCIEGCGEEVSKSDKLGFHMAASSFYKREEIDERERRNRVRVIKLMMAVSI